MSTSFFGSALPVAAWGPPSVVTEEIRGGERFDFGANWTRFLSVVNEERLARAAESLAALLGESDLGGKTFLDAGCGSGLFSAAARRLGALVHSFDIDPRSVACAGEMRRRYDPEEKRWKIEEGSLLDDAFLSSLGQFDIVYSWGVLHHTGALYRTLESVGQSVRRGGKLCVAVYNDQGGMSRRWRKIKAAYNTSPPWLRPVMVVLVAGAMETFYGLVRMANLRNPLPFAAWRELEKERGMSIWHDYVDWVGGYPFEVAKPEEIIGSVRRKGFILENLETCGGGHGCNQFVFSLPRDG